MFDKALLIYTFIKAREKTIKIVQFPIKFQSNKLDTVICQKVKYNFARTTTVMSVFAIRFVQCRKNSCCKICILIR